MPVWSQFALKMPSEIFGCQDRPKGASLEPVFGRMPVGFFGCQAPSKSASFLKTGALGCQLDTLPWSHSSPVRFLNSIVWAGGRWASWIFLVKRERLGPGVL